MADAHGLGPCVSNDVQVRLLSPALHYFFVLILAMEAKSLHIHKKQDSSFRNILFMMIPILVFLATFALSINIFR